MVQTPWCEWHTIVRLLDDGFADQRTSPDINRIIYDFTHFSSCHITQTYDILQPVSSYYFPSYNQPFKVGNFNIDMRHDLLLFSIWGFCSKRCMKRNLWPGKIAKYLMYIIRDICFIKSYSFYEDQCCTCFLNREGKKLRNVLEYIKNVLQY